MWRPIDAFREMARNDEAAFSFLSTFYLWVQSQDDLIDRDKPVDVKHAIGFNLGLLDTFAANPFFQKHRAFLMPVIIVSALAYIASEDFKRKTEVLDRITAQVLKSQYLDVFLAVCYCVGGFDHAVAMSAKYRDYSFDDEKPTGATEATAPLPQ